MLKNLLSGLRVARPNSLAWPWRLLVGLGLLLGQAGGAWAQSVASYVPTRTTGNTYTSIASTGTNYAWRNANDTDDNLSTPTPIGFVFAYNGLSYSQFSVSTNGLLTFNTGTSATGSGTGAYGFQNTQFSTAAGTVTTLAPFHDDQQTAANAGTLADLNASLKYLTTGTVGNRVLTAEWINMQDFATASTSSFNYQVKLYEADGHIEFNYGVMTYSGTTTTVSYSLGINSPTGGATAANLLTLQTANTNTFSSTASNSLGGTTAANMPTANSSYSFTAPVPAAPTTLTFTGVAASSMTVNFVDNSTTENNFQVVFSTDPAFATFSFGAITSTTKATTGTAYLANLTGLTPSTTYYVRVAAVTEVNSPALAGSQATLAPFAFGPGPYTIDNTQATGANGGLNFNNFTDAITALNTGTLSGPLTFNVAAGKTFVEVPPAITKSGTAVNSITFVKSGAGANPVIAPALNSGSGTVDYIVGLFGADYITFDGINLSDAASAAGTTAGQREVGYFMGPNSTTDGAQNNVIRNCTIGLNGGSSATVNTGSIGIFVSDNLTAAANATTAPNSNNKIYGNTITGPVTGIFLSGYSLTTAANQSTGNEVGTTAGNTITENGGAASAYGVRVDYQTGAKTENNIITVTNSAASTAAVRGIGYGASSSTGINGAVLINNNTVTLTLAGAASTAYGIVQGGGSTPTGVTITNNKVVGSVLSGATGAVNWIEDDFTVAAGTTTITGNQISGNTAATTGAMSCLYRVGANGTANISGNYVGVTAALVASANTLTGAGGTFYGIRATSGTVTVSNNYVQNNGFTNTSATTAATLYGYYNIGTPTAETVTGNTFTNLSIGGASTAATHVLVGIQAGANSTSKTVSGNIVGTLTLGTSGGTMSGTVTGINQLQGTTVGLSQNKIYGLTAYGASGSVTGIALGSGTTLNVANNLVGTLAAPAALGLVAVSGITVTSGTTANVYHNSVYLSASSAGATFGTSGIYLNSTSTNLDLRGNLVANTSTAAGTGGTTAALRRGSGTAATVPANYATTSNNNLFYAGPPSATNLIYVEGTTTATNAQQTLAAYKAFMVSRDQAAVTENPPFASTTGTASTFLHINPAVSTQIESGGATIASITTDFDGDTRTATPDIGADEGTFTPNDQTAPTIAYTALASTGSTANRTLVATITDVSGVATGAGAPRIYYRKGTSGAYFSALATVVAGSAYTFAIDYANVGGVPVAGDVFQYYVAAQDASSNSNTGTSPSGGSGINPPGSTAPGTPNQYTILPTLVGTYYVMGTAASGTSPDPTKEFATLTAAAAAYNSSGLSGAVRFLLFSNTQGTETYPITINANGDASVTNTLTIKPYTGVVTTLTNATTASTLKALSASYVTIDGSNTAGGTTRDLTLSNTSTTATAAALVWVASTTAAPSTGVQVRNLALLGVANTGTSAGVMVSNTTYNISTGGSANGVVIANNTVQGTSLGIVVGNDITTPGTGLQITNNVAGPATAATASNLGLYGIFVQQATGPVVTGNTVQNVVAPSGTPYGLNFPAGVTGATVSQNLITGVSAAAAASANAYGINLGTGFVNGVVDRNRVLNIVGSPTGGYGGKGIDVSTGSATSNLRISNNFVAGLTGSGWSSLTTDAIVGIRLLGTTGGVSLYYNSVSLSGSYNAASTSTYQSAALYVASTVTALDVRDNIFANTLVNSTSSSKAYAFYSAAAKTAFTTINYNDYFVGTGGQAFLGNLGGPGASVSATGDLTTLAAFQATTGTGQDANSLSNDPGFTSATDLHTNATVLNGSATPISGIPTDIDGDTRDAAIPDMGADEFTPVTIDLKPLALAAPTTTQGCYGPAETVTVTVKNQGINTLDFSLNPATVTAIVTGAASATLTGTLTSGTLAAGATQVVTLVPTLNMSVIGTYTFALNATVTGDQNTANDNLTPNPAITTVAPVAGTIAPATTTLCNSGTATLTLTGSANGSIQYQQSSSATGPFTNVATGGTTASYTTSVLTATTYYQALTTCGTTVATSNVATVTVNTPLISSTNSPQAVCSGSAAMLTANGSSGTTVRFFAAATGGTALATGATGAATASYTTPALTTAATYYAEAFKSGTFSMGPLTNTGSGGQSSAPQYIIFNVSQPIVLAGVNVYPGAAGNVVIEYRSSTGTVLQSATVAVTAAQINTKTFIPLNFSLAAGTAQRLGIGTGSVTMFRNDAGASYPYTGGGISITGNSFDPTYYYYFYDWLLATECVSATRTAVQATVNPRPTAAFNGSSPATVCAGTGTTLTGTLTGTAPFTGQYSVDGGAAQTLTISGSTFSIATGNLTASTTYAITALSDASCTATSFPAAFTVNPTTTTTYTGAAAGDGTNWFNAANWTACVPSSTIDAVVPAGLGNYPSLSTTATAEVRTLTIATGASLGQSAGRLAVYGNLSNSGTVDLTGGTVALLGSSPVVTGLSTFYALEVNLSSGTMALSNATSISNQLSMKTGVLSTSSFTLTLLTGSLLVEDDNSYLLGTVSVPDRTLTAGTTESFSGIGLVLTPAVGSTSPGSTPVVRTTGTALTGVGTSVSIKRYFDIQPAVNTGLNVAMDFSYLNHELNGIPGGNLALFKSVTTTAGPWANQSPTTALANTISKTGIADFSIWTLGNATNPLPVELTAFTAERQGRNAALAWTTATEKNSRGFEVQVSTDGRSFRTLEFVASPTASSTAPRSYAYLDQEAGKAGLRYYRLRQVDLSGAATFAPVRTVRFDAVFALNLTAAPNPFEGHLTLTVELPAGPATAPASLSLTDAAGRTLRVQPTPALPAGPSQLELPGLASLASGVYFVHLAVPGQPTQHLKVVKE